MGCAETLRTQAYLDGEVDDADAEAAARHIEGCAECQAICDDAAALSDAIRKAAVRHRAPNALRARVGRMLDDEAATGTKTWTNPRKAMRRDFWLGAGAGAGLTALAAGLALLLTLPPSAAGLSASITDAHVRALMAGREIEVVSSDHHTVKPWFAGRVEVSPPVTDFAAQGFKLIGGRLDHIAGARAAVVAYQHGRHEIDLFVWADRGAALPESGLRHGYRSVLWKAGDLDFAAVSDVQGSELANFVTLVRGQPE